MPKRHPDLGPEDWFPIREKPVEKRECCICNRPIFLDMTGLYIVDKVGRFWHQLCAAEELAKIFV